MAEKLGGAEWPNWIKAYMYFEVLIVVFCSLKVVATKYE
jgi:hypothetical protein